MYIYIYTHTVFKTCPFNTCVNIAGLLCFFGRGDFHTTPNRFGQCSLENEGLEPSIV